MCLDAWGWISQLDRRVFAALDPFIVRFNTPRHGTPSYLICTSYMHDRVVINKSELAPLNIPGVAI
jgi:hypothetical protein